MVGPLSAAGTMAERMNAVHRWCVTGGLPWPWHACVAGESVMDGRLPSPHLFLQLDPAQLAGSPFNSAMRGIHAPPCPAGTPMGAHKNELTDIHALLSTLQHQPFAGGGMRGG